jgi:hypothetical protein
MRSEILWERRGEEVKVREGEMVDLGDRSEVRDRSFEVCMMEGMEGSRGVGVFGVLLFGDLMAR